MTENTSHHTWSQDHPMRWRLHPELLIPALLVLVVCLLFTAIPHPELAVGKPGLLLIAHGTAREQLDILDEAWEIALARGEMPNLGLARIPEDLGELTVKERKRYFLRGIAPLLVVENRKVAGERARLRGLLETVERGRTLDARQRGFIVDLARRYGPRDLRDEENPVEVTRELLVTLVERVDTVPTSLGLAQAAIESAWGTSRFARLGNNLFGHWVFSADKGIAPKRRPEGADYAVARFDTIADSVEGYVTNLNRLWAYETFRKLRARMRNNGGGLDGLELAQGLEYYSIRRGKYVRDVRQIIRGNGLKRFDALLLSERPAREWRALLQTLD